MTEIQERFISGTPEFPYHISIGAVLLNEKNEVCVHHFSSITLEGKTAKNFYILMRETPEPNESIVATVHRGLLEEFGADAEVIHYIGPIVCKVDYRNLKEKTTLYFLCRLKNQDIGLRKKDDPESGSTLEWHDLEFLITKMKKQRMEFGFEDIDESAILQRVEQLIAK